MAPSRRRSNKDSYPQLHCIATLNSNRKKLSKEVKHFLNYCATHPNAGIRYVASDMILALHASASYLSETNSKSRAAGHFYLTRKSDEYYNNDAI